jgi:rhamnulokinase
MPAKIVEFCRETKQAVPTKPGEFTRTILESLALAYAQTLQELERVLGRKFEKLHIVGGGSRSQLLNQFTADATGVRVVAGPVEATAIGNVLIQALALGHLGSAAELRGMVEHSFPTQLFVPGAKLLPDEARHRFQQLVSKKT